MRRSGIIFHPWISGIAIAAMVGLFCSPTRGSVVIDDFHSGDQTVSIIGGNGLALSTTSSVSGSFSDDPIGNAREIIVERLSGSGNVTLDAGPSNSSTISLDAPSAVATGIFSYGNLSDLNLNLSKDTDFIFDFAKLTASLPMVVTVSTDGGGMSLASVSAPKSATSFELPFTDFAGSANFANIDQISVSLTSSGGAVQLESFASVPEPASALMLLILGPLAIWYCKS